MSTPRRPSAHNLPDLLITQFDQALRTLLPGSGSASRPSPAARLREAELDAPARRHAAGLMRVNHTGEVCAQALYQGQSLSARSDELRASMEEAAREESDHLVWCEARLRELDSRPSLLNPLWYGLSFGLGAAAGLAGDRWSLGFVAETEDQVCEHLVEHKARLPAQDARSAAVLDQMIEDESRHAHNAREAGGRRLPFPVRLAMKGMAKVMKASSYRL